MNEAEIDCPRTVVEAVPSLVTNLGLAGALIGLRDSNPYFLCIAIMCDALDGWLARRLGAVTRFGEHLDQIADRTVAAVGAWWLFDGGPSAPFAVILVVVLQVGTARGSFRASGRLLVLSACIAKMSLGGPHA